MEDTIINNILYEIPSFFKWVKAEQVNKGWSTDRKYYMKNNNGEQFLLRISDLIVMMQRKRNLKI